MCFVCLIVMLGRSGMALDSFLYQNMLWDSHGGCFELRRAETTSGILLWNISALRSVEQTWRQVTSCQTTALCRACKILVSHFELHRPLKDGQVIFHLIVVENNPRILSLKEKKSFTNHRKQGMLASCLFTVGCDSICTVSQSCHCAAFPVTPAVCTHKGTSSPRNSNRCYQGVILGSRWLISRSCDLSGFEHRRGQTCFTSLALTAVPVAAFLTATGFAR